MSSWNKQKSELRANSHATKRANIPATHADWRIFVKYGFRREKSEKFGDFRA